MKHSLPEPMCSSPAERVNVFAAGAIDRLAERRRDERWLRERLHDPDTRFLPLWNLQVLVRTGDAPGAVLLSERELGEAVPQADELILLGELEGRTVFAIELGGEAPPPLPGELVELREVGALLDASEAALLAQARGMMYWRSRHRFCGACGHPTRAEEAGNVRACGGEACGVKHFPRTDPAIIVLVTRGDRCLLARQAHWPPKRYAVIAGFVEPGESLEDAVGREVHEEVGLRVDEVRYHSSQPWPFPSSLMLGFTAVAGEGDLRLDTEELEAAHWFSREEVMEAVRTEELSLPPRHSIAYALLRDWLAGALSED